MPRIHPCYSECSFYLYHSRADAERATVHPNGGTGFLVGLPYSQGEGVHLYGVTARHVIIKSPVVRLNTKEGSVDVLELTQDNWLFNDNHDIAVAPLKLSDEHRYHYVPFRQFITPQIMEDEKFGPGDRVFMVGRFVNHEGTQRNIPSLRFGNLSMMPLEPVRNEKHPKRFQESFLVDIRTVGGYSGSPVFLFVNNITFSGHDVEVGPRNEPWLLGVEWGHLLDHYKNNSGMSGVVPAWHISALLNSPEFVAAREEVEQT